MSYIEERKVKFYPDSSSGDLDFFTIQANGMRYLQSERPFRQLGHEDRLVKKYIHGDQEPEMYYELMARLLPTNFFKSNLENEPFLDTVEVLLKSAELTATENRVLFRYRGVDMFSICDGVPILYIPHDADDERLMFDPQRQFFGFHFDIPSRNEAVPDIRFSFAMDYKAEQIKKAYELPRHKFESEDFYKMIREGVNAHVILGRIPYGPARKV